MKTGIRLAVAAAFSTFLFCGCGAQGDGNASGREESSKAIAPPSATKSGVPRDSSHHGKTNGKTPSDDDELGSEHYHATWALIVGINEYDDKDRGFGRLLYAVNDARELHSLLRNDFGYDDDHVRLVIDKKDATFKKLCDTFEHWPPNDMLKENDALLVFFAGHGDRDETTQDGYLAAVDSRRKDSATCLSMAWVRDRLAEKRCQHRLLILDTCYSGRLFQQRPMATAPFIPRPVTSNTGKRSPESSPTGNPGDCATTPGPAIDEFGYLLAEPSFWGMSAGRDMPVEDGLGKDRHSVFTAAFLQVLRERADSGRTDHAFTFRQLAGQVEARVRDAHIGQIPDWGPLGPGDGDFVFAPLPAHLGKTPREVSQQRDLIVRTRRYADRMNRTRLYLQGTLQGSALSSAGRAWHESMQDDDLRGFEWYYLWKQRHLQRGSLNYETGQDDIPRGLAYLPDGRLGVLHNSHLMLLTLGLQREKAEIRPFTDATGVHSLRLTADRQNFVVIRDIPSAEFLADPMHEIQVWQLEPPHVKWVFQFPEPVHAYRVSDDGNLVASFGKSLPRVGLTPDMPSRRDELNHTLTLWDIASGTKVTATEELDVEALGGFSPDGRTLAVSARASEADHRIVLLDVPSLRQRASTEPTPLLAFREFSPDGRFVVAASEGFLEVYDASTGAKRGERLHGWFSDHMFSPDSTRLVFARGELPKATIAFWSVSDSGLVTSDALNGPQEQHAFSPDGRRLAWKYGGFLGITDTTTGESLRKQFGSIGYRLAFSSDGRELATADYSPAQERVYVEWYDQDLWTRPLFDSPVFTAAFSPDGRLIATEQSGRSGTGKDLILVQDATTRKEIAKIPVSLGMGGRDHVRNSPRLVFSPDSKYLAFVCNGRIEVWSPSTRDKVSSFAPLRHVEPPGITCAAMSGDRKLLVTGGGREVTLWDVAGLHELGHFTTDCPVQAVEFSPDGALLACYAPGIVDVWSTTTHEKRWSFSTSVAEPACLCFSQDSSHLSLTMYNRARGAGSLPFWNLFSGVARELRSEGVWLASVSRDLKLLAEVHWKGRPGTEARVQLSSMETGEPIALLGTYTDGFRSLVFSPDNKYLAAETCPSSEIRLWDIVQKKEVGGILESSGGDRAIGLGFSSDGRLLTTWCRTYEIPSGRLVETRVQERQASFLQNEPALLLVRNGVAFVKNGVVLRDINTGDEKALPVPAGSWRARITDFSHDGRMIGVACEQEDGLGAHTKVFEVATGRQLHFADRSLSRAHAVSFSPVEDTMALLVARDAQAIQPYRGENRTFDYHVADVEFWDITRSQHIHSFGPVQISDRAVFMSYSPNGRLLAIETREATTGNSSRVLILDAASRQVVSIVDDEVVSGAFTPDSRRFIGCGGANPGVRLWDVATGVEVFEFGGPERGTSSSTLLPTISPDGRYLVATRDIREQALVWCAATPSEVAAYGARTKP